MITYLIRCTLMHYMTNMKKFILDHLYQVLVKPGVVLHHLGHLVVVVLRHQGLHLGKEIESLSFATRIFRNTKLE